MSAGSSREGWLARGLQALWLALPLGLKPSKRHCSCIQTALC